MSADMLRRAASLMRERAQAAQASLPNNAPEWHSVDALMGEGKTRGDAKHIALWRPEVALAVADWLDHETRYFATQAGGCALTVARAYLGSDLASPEER